ncbi:hypothetical protein TNCV_1554631, partial [Trichonephila clavipes]
MVKCLGDTTYSFTNLQAMGGDRARMSKVSGVFERALDSDSRDVYEIGHYPRRYVVRRTNWKTSAWQDFLQLEYGWQRVDWTIARVTPKVTNMLPGRRTKPRLSNTENLKNLK